jgi:hypothetical protein
MLRLGTIFTMLLLLVTPSFAHGPLLDDKMVVGLDFLSDQYSDLVAKHGSLPAPQRKVKPQGITIGDTQTFWTINVATNQPEQTEATLRIIGKHCYIYLELEREQYVSQKTLEKITKRFDEQIYPTNHRFFGSENKPGIDFDDRVTLLFLDIQDGWEPGKGYVGGYFSPMDGVSSSLWDYSNEREMVYLDVYPADATRKDYLGILAHEFQHMIHSAQDNREELWLNEGMSQVAFYANDFGHAPQILSFIKGADTQIDEFNNGIDDYGAVYLFFYYLATKHLGSMDNAANILREIVASKEKGLASIDTILEKYEIEARTDEIVRDWLIANFVNDPKLGDGRYGYDTTLPMKVQPTHVFNLKNLPTEAIEETVNLRAADFIVFTDEIKSLPMNATLIDKIRIFSDFEGSIHWNINEGILPPEAFIPSQSEVDGNQVKMPTQIDEQGRHFVEIGPFRNGGVRVTRVNYTARSNDTATSGSIPVYSFQTFASKEPAMVSFHFDGQKKSLISKKRKFSLRKFVEYKDGRKELSEIELDKKNDATWTDDLSGVEKYALIPVSVMGKTLKYKLSFETGTAKSHSSLLDEWVSDENRFLGKLMDYPKLLESFKKDWDQLPRRMQKNLGEDFRQFLRTYQFLLLDPAQNHPLKAPGLKGQLTPQGADQDDSHDNLAFLIKKAREGSHSLSHLQIDPKMIEGQILKMWKLLEIARGFPHLPLPDGLGIVDYKVAPLEAMLQDWSLNGTDQHKETLRRLALAESAILSSYNEGLSMADDVGLVVLDLVSFFMTARNATSLLLNPLIKKGGFKGRLAKKISLGIQAKLLYILNKVAVMASVKLPAPYNTSVPIVFSVASFAYRKWKDVPWESDQQDWKKEFAFKTLAKYTLMSLPVVGIVHKGNPNITYLANKAAEMKTTYTLDDAQEDVRDQLYEILTDINTTHAKTEKKRNYAKIAKKVAEISALTGTLDPSSLSKVVALVATVTGAGLLTHSIYSSSKVLYSIPDRVPAAIDAAFTPFSNEDDEKEARSNALTYSLKPNQISLLENRLPLAMKQMFRSLGGLSTDASLQNLETYLRADQDYTESLKEAEMLLLGSVQESESSILELSQNDLLRSQIQVEALLGNTEKVSALSQEIERRETQVLVKLQTQLRGQRTLPVVSVRKDSLQWSGTEFTLRLKLQATATFPELMMKVYAGPEFSLKQDKFKVSPETDSLVIRGQKSDRSIRSTLHFVLETPSGVRAYPSVEEL